MGLARTNQNFVHLHRAVLRYTLLKSLQTWCKWRVDIRTYPFIKPLLPPKPLSVITVVISSIFQTRSSQVLSSSMIAFVMMQQNSYGGVRARIPSASLWTLPRRITGFMHQPSTRLDMRFVIFTLKQHLLVLQWRNRFLPLELQVSFAVAMSCAPMSV